MNILKLLLGVTFFSVGSITAFAEAPLKKAFQIGLIAPLSGEASSFGESAKNGVLMAIEELNISQKIKVVVEDDAYTPAKTVTAFNKLVDVDNVDLILTVASTPSNAVAPIAERRRIPLIAWASDPNVSRNRKYVVRSYPSGETEGEIAITEAKKRGLTKIAIFTSQDDYSFSWKLGIEKSLAADHIVFNETVMDESNDYRTLILKSKAKGARGYAICLKPGKLGLMARQIRETYRSAVIFGCENLNNPDENKIAQGALSGAWFSTLQVDDSFNSRYQKRYGNSDSISAAANFYDTIVLLNRLDLAENSEDLIDQMLRQSEINGVIGPFKVIEVDGDRHFDIPLVIKEVTTEGFKTIR